jgi:integrase
MTRLRNAGRKRQSTRTGRITRAHEALGCYSADGLAGAGQMGNLTSAPMGGVQKAYQHRNMSGMLHNACERSRENAGIGDYSPHDLRRTAATTMAELGVPRFITERVSNHTDRTVTSDYDRYSYRKEEMAAVIKLGAFVERMAKRHRSRRVA